MTDCATLLALADRCEQAAGPDKELDRCIREALGFCTHRKATRYTYQSDSGFECDDCGIDLYGKRSWPSYTSDLNAAVALVPTEPPRNLRIGKWWWMMETWSDYCRASVNYENGDSAILEESAEAATPALALCAAALRARARAAMS
jgi:hypothetical protein